MIERGFDIAKPSQDAGGSTFSIGELARRTGVPVATLRAWEIRHGEPRALPRTVGHRRYDEQAVSVVNAILERRAAGYTLDAAVASVRDQKPADRSLFGELRNHHPELTVLELTKPSLLAMTFAAEDEYVALAQRAVLFAGFQSREFFLASRSRYRELTRVADAVVVFADFGGDVPADEGGLVHIGFDETSPLRREWFVVCDSPELPFCIVAREALAPESPHRRFDAVWSVDPAVVRTAARLCAERLRTVRPDQAARLSRHLQNLEEAAPGLSPDLRRATSLFQRVVGYLDRGLIPGRR